MLLLAWVGSQHFYIVWSRTGLIVASLNPLCPSIYSSVVHHAMYFLNASGGWKSTLYNYPLILETSFKLKWTVEFHDQQVRRKEMRLIPILRNLAWSSYTSLGPLFLKLTIILMVVVLYIFNITLEHTWHIASMLLLVSRFNWFYWFVVFNPCFIIVYTMELYVVYIFALNHDFILGMPFSFKF